MQHPELMEKYKGDLILVIAGPSFICFLSTWQTVLSALFSSEITYANFLNVEYIWMLRTDWENYFRKDRLFGVEEEGLSRKKSNSYLCFRDSTTLCWITDICENINSCCNRMLGLGSCMPLLFSKLLQIVWNHSGRNFKALLKHSVFHLNFLL